MGRFEYVKYDGTAVAQQEAIKGAFEEAEARIEHLEEGRAKSLALSYLEIAYMWTGKSIRDSQIARGGPNEHVDSRG